MSGTSFENSEKLDILIKEQFQVTSTNENTPWYLETNVDYNTYTNGKDILIDEFNVVSTSSQNWWATVSKQTSSSFYSQYGLSLASDFATDSDAGIYISSDGMLQRFEKIKLEYIQNSDSGAPSGKAYSYTKITSSGGNILTNSFQTNFGDGFSFTYNLYSSNSSGG